MVLWVIMWWLSMGNWYIVGTGSLCVLNTASLLEFSLSVHWGGGGGGCEIVVL